MLNKLNKQLFKFVEIIIKQSLSISIKMSQEIVLQSDQPISSIRNLKA